MKFKIPQFIEVEDKVIGPFSLKQFLYLAIGGGILFALWFIVGITVFIIVAMPIAVVALVFAFYRVNGRPFTAFLTSLFEYLTKPRLYVWRKHK